MKMDNKRTSILDKLRPDLQQHFSVPKLTDKEESPFSPNKNLACFLIFLLKILDDEAHSFSENQESLYSILQKKLSFLHAFLGDTPFQCIELEATMTLLTEFETVANEVGSFIYSCLSASSDEKRSNNFDTGIRPLLEKVDTFMNEYIKAHCSKDLPEAVTPRTNHLSSLFIIGSLLEDLQDLMDGRFELNIDDIKDQINKLVEELTFLQIFLNDIQKSQVIHTNHELQASLIDLIGVAYEGEYIINAHTAGHIPSWYLNLRIPIVVRKIQKIGTRVQNLKKNHNVKGEKIQAFKYPEQDLGIVVGFENIREPILAHLVGGSKALQYVSVFGMSGIGKSTVAKKLYNDRVVREYFDVCVWCNISQTYDKNKVLGEIWISLPRKSGKDETSNYENLALRIYQTLIGRKYLIIMDDVWDSRISDDLRSCFPDDRNGSRILLTSQIKDIAPACSIFHQLPLLSNSQCYELLTKKVFIKEPIPAHLLDIARRIASKCHRLPLTVVVIAGILVNVGRDESAWRNVESHMDSRISDDSSMRILELSFEYLPNRLKPCFLSVYWSFVRKDIRVKDMIPLWISHGYVVKVENKSKEEIAEEYLWELINRSMLIITKRRSDGGIKVCEFHDLIADMCQRRVKIEKLYSRVDEFPLFNYIEDLHINLPLEPSNINNISALPCHSVSTMISSLGHSVTQMPLLRVIKGQQSPIDEKRMGNLVHLRYFGAYARIAQLSEGICKLLNLEYLHLQTDHKVDVPSTILKMVKLRDIRIASQVIFYVNCDASQIRNNVKSLSRIRIRNHDDEEILKCSPHLRELKCICERMFLDLSSHTLLESINMSIFHSPGLKGELTKMNFPSTLKNVTLSGTKLPWEESSVLAKLPNLQVLKLLYDAFCGKEWETRDEEFQELKFLKIHNTLSLRQWISCSEHFPKLQRLLLDHVRVEIPLDFGNISTLQTIEDGANCGYEVYESVDLIRQDQLDYDNEDLKVIIRGFDKKKIAAPYPRGEGEDGKAKTNMELEEEVFGKSIERSLNVKRNPDAKSPQPQASTPPWKICAGCNSSHGSFRIVRGYYWHRECFCCHACKHPIYDVKFRLDSNNCHYHNSCYKDVYHAKCYVCKDFVKIDVDGNNDGQLSKFWDLTCCKSHLTDGTPECCSCYRFESLDDLYSTLEDSRALCLECSESSIIRNTEECELLCMEIRDFMEGLNIKVKEDILVLLVNKQAMDEATKGEGYRSHLVYTEDTDEDEKTRVVISSILVLDGLPRIVTGYRIAIEMMDSWMLLEGYENLNIKVKAGIQQVLGHLWLEHEIVSSSSEKSRRSEFENKLGEYWKYCIETDSRCDYRDGFSVCKKVVDKYGLRPTLDHIRRTGTFPD